METNTTRDRCNRYSGRGHGMQGRPLQRSLNDAPRLVLCIEPYLR
jgi:hypothetical protein